METKHFVEKQACQNLAIHGIILSILILLLGAGGTFLVTALSRSDLQGQAAMYWTLGLGLFGAGVLLLMYNIFLLKRVMANRGKSVFKTIKFACLAFLFGELLINCYYLVSNSIALACPHQVDGQAVLVGIVVSRVLLILLTALGIFGIEAVKPKIVSVYTCIKGIFFTLVIIIILVMIKLKVNYITLLGLPSLLVLDILLAILFIIYVHCICRTYLLNHRLEIQLLVILEFQCRSRTRALLYALKNHLVFVEKGHSFTLWQL